MLIRVAVNTGVPRDPVRVFQLEAHGYQVDPRLGTLTITAVRPRDGMADAIEPVVVYAPGVWRTVSDVGALDAADGRVKEQPRENPRRRQEARPAEAP